MTLYTASAVAEWLGITAHRVRQLRNEGVLVEVKPGLYNMKQCVQRYLNYKTGDGGAREQLTAEKARRERTRADLEEMQLEVARGELHKTEDVEKALNTMIANFRTRMLEIPAKHAGTLVQITDQGEAFTLLKDAIYEALDELSDFDKAMAEPDEEEAENAE